MPSRPSLSTISPLSAATVPECAVVRVIKIPREGLIWLAAMLALWIVGWVKNINLILLLAYLLFFLWSLNLWKTMFALQNIWAIRKLPTPIFAGQPFIWQVDLESRASQVAQGLEVIDRVQQTPVFWFVTQLTPGQFLRLRSEVCLHQRGQYRLKPLRVQSSFPFGLLRREVKFAREQDLLVMPRLGILNTNRLRRWLMQTARPDERTRHSRRKLSQEMEFHGLRAYRSGDSPRWIHWRTSARSGELMVREFDQGTHNDLLVIVEAFDAGENYEIVERSISLAATICWNWMREGDRITLVCLGETGSCLVGIEGQASGLKLLEALACLRGGANPDWTTVARKLKQSDLPYGPALFISSRPHGTPSLDRLSRMIDRPIAFVHGGDPPEFFEYMTPMD